MNLLQTVLGACMIFGVGAAPACSEKKVQPQISQKPVMPVPGTEVPMPPPNVATLPPTSAPRTSAGDSLRIIAPNTLSGQQFSALMQRAIDERLHEKSLGEIIQTVGQWFVGKPYVAGLLDQSQQEQLVVDFGQFDCVLYVETVTALAKVISRQEYDYDKFAGYLGSLRYRNGTMNGYGSRLHYFTDWIFDNSARGNVNDLSAAFEGVAFRKTLNFMGTHRNSYPQLKTDDALFNQILEMERSLRNRPLFHIPKAQIRNIYDRLQVGDIITTTTNIEGLDVTHTGFVFVQPNGQKGFMHASSAGKQVMISQDLHDYVNGIRSQVGIMVIRPADGRTRYPRGKF